MGSGSTRREKSPDILARWPGGRLGVFFTMITAGIWLFAPVVNSRYSIASADTAAAPQASRWLAQMPEGNAKSIVLEKCQECHSLGRIVLSHRTKDEWKELVRNMIDHGAPLTSEELSMVVDYLAANFGPAELNSPSAVSTSTIQPVPGSVSDLIVDPDQAQFSPVPDSMGLPIDVQMSVVSGDPAKTGPFSILLKIPTGLVFPPHRLSGDETIVCLRGAFQIGEGDSFEAGKLRTLSPGAVWHAPAQTNYFATAKDSTIVLVYGDGPLSMTVK